MLLVGAFVAHGKGKCHVGDTFATGFPLSTVHIEYSIYLSALVSMAILPNQSEKVLKYSPSHNLQFDTYNPRVKTLLSNQLTPQFHLILWPLLSMQRPDCVHHRGLDGCDEILKKANIHHGGTSIL